MYVRADANPYSIHTVKYIYQIMFDYYETADVVSNLRIVNQTETIFVVHRDHLLDDGTDDIEALLFL